MSYALFACMGKMNKLARLAKVAEMAPLPSFRVIHDKPGLYLLELRSHHSEVHMSLRKRKIIIPIKSHRGPDEAPKPVKITFK